ncbi:hypothetical protein T492DRAFT_844681 [Pavlovales sp. CCMP2436]|nr:hypothetical protein T492DRAFT_844681 [Pavlovales sp. CCMP2436]|mmetsp:Transcript_10532/g.26534  ORF Transcript_10532/g.26534 Transcript_10532/m.26534 type:complete len:177 (+) Transcript_10532:57-587(+)
MRGEVTAEEGVEGDDDNALVGSASTAEEVAEGEVAEGEHDDALGCASDALSAALTRLAASSAADVPRAAALSSLVVELGNRAPVDETIASAAAGLGDARAELDLLADVLARHAQGEADAREVQTAAAERQLHLLRAEMADARAAAAAAESDRSRVATERLEGERADARKVHIYQGL